MDANATFDKPGAIRSKCGVAARRLLGGIPLAEMHRLIQLQPETFERLVEEARYRQETVETAADRILREHLPVMCEANSTLATLGRLAELRARMKPSKGAVQIVHEGRRELGRRQL
jgi:hypothetical protein